MKKIGGKEVLAWVEITVFVVAVILQNFAIFTTASFGIALSTAVLIYFFIRHKLYKKIDKKIIFFVAGLGVLMTISGLVNSDLRILSIFRTLMVVFDVWCTYQYVESLNKRYRSSLLKVFFWGYVGICFYGAYEYFAQQFGWPRFLNIFSNNPSYGAMGVFASNKGWSNSSRIFTCFSEPSFYSVFLVYGFFLLAKFGKMSKKNLAFLAILFVANLFLASARTGIVYLGVLGIAIAVDRWIKNGTMKNIAKGVMVLMPILVFVLTHLAGLAVFKDLSVKSRSYSSMYYLEHSFDGVQGVIVGHGAESMHKVAEEKTVVDGARIEEYAHNGYVEILYRYGLVILAAVLVVLVLVLEKIPERHRIFMYGAVFSLCCTGGLYNVETIVILTAMLYGYARIGKRYDIMEKA